MYKNLLPRVHAQGVMWSVCLSVIVVAMKIASLYKLGTQATRKGMDPYELVKKTGLSMLRIVWHGPRVSQIVQVLPIPVDHT